MHNHFGETLKAIAAAMGEKIIEELHSPNCETLDKGDLICTN